MKSVEILEFHRHRLANEGLVLYRHCPMPCPDSGPSCTGSKNYATVRCVGVGLATAVGDLSNLTTWFPWAVDPHQFLSKSMHLSKRRCDGTNSSSPAQDARGLPPSQLEKRGLEATEGMESADAGAIGKAG